MAKSKSRDELEELRGKNRSLLKENRELKKTLGRLEKRSYRAEELEELFQEMSQEDESTPRHIKPSTCSCGGKVEKIDLGVRMVFKCVDCGKRETKKK